MTEYAGALAPHPWDEIGRPPRLGATYDREPVAARYHLTYEYEATVEVLNAEDFTPEEIDKALRESHAEDMRQNGPHDEDVFVSDPLPGDAKADYRVRLERTEYAVQAEVVS